MRQTLPQLRKAQDIIDAFNRAAEHDERHLDALVSALAGILICDLRGEDKGPGVATFDLPACLRRYADMIDCANGVVR